MKSVVKLEQVARSFVQGERTFTALKDVTLDINKGEYIAIVGKSGSGKSTMLNLITGIDHPTNATVRVNNTDIHGLDESDLARWRGKNIGIVFQFFQLIPTLTINENILLAMEFVDAIPRRDRAKRAASLLEMVGIAGHADKFPSALSGGEQQRAAIAARWPMTPKFWSPMNPREIWIAPRRARSRPYLVSWSRGAKP